jgi:polysaccharide export outer membrane protein
MMTLRFARARCLLLLAALAGSALCGCYGSGQVQPAPAADLPRELIKTRLSDYIIEPPDILVIDATSVVPKPPYKVTSGDILLIQVPNAFETEPINGGFPVEPEGTINLGASYGVVTVVGLTIPEIKKEITKLLSGLIKEPKVFVGLGQSRARQQIRGQHLVTPDGRIRLGLYGEVPVSGLTVAQAKQAIEAHLANFILNPEISVDVAAYNSKIIYVIFDGAGSGQQITRLPVTGNDTVLDCMAQVGGLTSVSSENRIWVARPAPADAECDQILPVDWKGITMSARTATNYQLLPGDRLYVQAQPLVRLETTVGKIIAPLERIFGFGLLSQSVVRAFRSPTNGGNGTGL